VASPMPRLALVKTAVLAVRLRFMALQLRNGRRVVAGGRLSRARRVLVEGGHRAPGGVAGSPV